MVELIIKELDSNEISQLLRTLKEQGYKVGVDFNFEYSAGRWDWQQMHQIPRQTKFICYNENLATWISLRWS